MISQISSHQQIHHKIQVLSILKGICHIHNKRMLQLRQKLSLVQNRVNALFTYDLCLMHLFHGVNFLIFFEFNAPNLSKSSFANNILAVKMLSTDLFAVQIDVIVSFFLCLEFREIDFKAIFNVLIGLFGYCGVASIVLFLSFAIQVFAFSSLVIEMCSTGHGYSITSTDAVLSIQDLWYLEWFVLAWWLCTGIFIVSTFGLLPRWELRTTDFMGMLMGIVLFIFLIRLLTMVADDFRDYYLLDVLGMSSLLMV